MGMDEYARLLKLKSEYSKLNKLIHDLLNIDPARPEVFVALSDLWERKAFLQLQKKNERKIIIERAKEVEESGREKERGRCKFRLVWEAGRECEGEE